MQISQWQWDAMSNILEWLKSNGLTTLRSGTSLVVQWLTLRLPKQGTTTWLLGPGGLHMPRSDYYWASTTEPVHESLCSAAREATTMRSWHPTNRECPPLTTTRESQWAARKTQCSQKLIIKKKTTVVWGCGEPRSFIQGWEGHKMVPTTLKNDLAVY